MTPSWRVRGLNFFSPLCPLSVPLPEWSLLEKKCVFFFPLEAHLPRIQSVVCRYTRCKNMYRLKLKCPQSWKVSWGKGQIAFCACSPGEQVLQFLESDLASVDHCPALSLTSVSDPELAHLESTTIVIILHFRALSWPTYYSLCPVGQSFPQLSTVYSVATRSGLIWSCHVQRHWG